MTSDADPVEPTDRPDIRHIDALLGAAGRSGHYRVVSQVGEGGSGVVYKAIDTRLNRAVAIKAIHATRLMDARVTTRLRTEAMAAASLDHPYICRIYELIETGDEKLIVMEFVEGETLSGVLGRGMPPLSQTLQFGIEIAEGLANAHERGLVHRDLKPSNVMVTPHGHIKLLDFGLALADAASTPTDETRTVAKATDAYAGTPQYMAPEQATGKSVTARSDLFSFGVVLFRCVTGALPFRGSSPYDYASHLLSDAPTPVHRLAPNTPADLARLIDRCLEKNPALRPDSATVVVQELRRLAEALSSSGGAVRSIRSHRAESRWRLIAIVGVLAAVAAVAWRWYPRTESSETLWRSHPFVTAPSDESDSRISPDRQWVSFLSTLFGETRLLVKRIDGGEAQRVALPAGEAMGQLWSPTGDQLAYVLRQGESVLLQVIPAFFGGVPVQSITIMPASREVRLLRWIGRTIYLECNGSRGYFLQRVDLDRGTAESISGAWASVGRLTGLDVSPDGRRVAFTASVEGQEDLWVANVDGTSAKRLTEDQSFERRPLWSGPGTTVIYQSNRGGQIDLWEISPDSGRSHQLTSSRTEEQPESTSLDGTLVSFRQVSEDAHLGLWNSSRDSMVQLTDDALSDFAPTSTASGSAVVFQRSQPNALLGNPILDTTLHTGTIDRMKFSAEPTSLTDGFAARVSPDGSRLAYLQKGVDRLHGTLLVRNLQTSEAIALSRLCPLPAFSRFPLDLVEQNLAWSSSSTDLYFVERPDGSTIRRFRVGASEPEAPVVSTSPGDLIHDLHLSPSGHLLAYLVTSSKSRTSSLHLVDLSSGADRVTARFDASVSARGWLPDDAGVVLVKAGELGEDATVTVEVVGVSPTGVVRRLGVLERVFAETSRLDTTRSTLYITRSEGGVHNLYALSLTSRALRRVTDNAQPDVTFSGVEPLEGGSIIGVRQERKSDIWLIDASPVSAAAPGRQSR